MAKLDKAITRLLRWKMRRFKLREISAITGVSVATLSNAVRDPSTMSNLTIDKILAAQEPKL